MMNLLDPALLEKIAMYVVIVNIALTALKSILDKVDPTDDQKANSKVYQVVSKVVSVMSMVVDWVSANKAH